LSIYNILGQKVRTLIAGKKLQAGVYRVHWLAKDNAGRSLPTGIYFAVLRAGNRSLSEKLILLK
jgi:flagellar hook assembly protein FlgD